mgnify:CR=1 FL=1
MKKRVAFITGITGQDGSYLAEFLLQKGYEVHGMRRRASTENLQNIENILTESNFHMHYGDMTDSSNLNKLLGQIKPSEIYNLAAQSHVHTSFLIPEYTAQVNALGCLNLLEAMINNCPKSKFYQASTSELYGEQKSKKKQNEKTIFNPCSPYSISKLYAFHLVQNYRQRGFYACNGILFNHESPRRGPSFISQKIVQAAVRIKKNKQKFLSLGNLYAKRDWGYAKEYVEVMWKMMQSKKPDDFVISTNKSYSVKYLVEKVFMRLGVKINWQGKGLKEIGINEANKKTIIKIDPYYFRPKEVNYLCGDSSKARKKIKWINKINLEKLINIMINAELKKY